MTTGEAGDALIVPARVIPLPASVSEEMGAFLRRGPVPDVGHPPLHDRDAWRSAIAAVEEAMLAGLASVVDESGDVEAIEVGTGARVDIVTPSSADECDRRTYLELHGGSLIAGGGACSRANGRFTAARVGLRTWAVDYRMPPDHP
ncbi:MAG: alpha/beta hydrolase, partial [Candidatus Limnocylindria bacterium]